MRNRNKNKIAVVLLLSSLLNGCVAVVVAGAAAGLVVYDRRSVRTIGSDTALFQNIHKRIATDSRFADSRIVVASFNRVVLLVGQVNGPVLKAEAERIARSTQGIDRVYNELSIAHPIPLTQRSKDTWITGQVRTAMLARKSLESGNLHIVTENGVVYLMGVVTLNQSNLAVDVARRINGVNKVVKIFLYIH